MTHLSGWTLALLSLLTLPTAAETVLPLGVVTTEPHELMHKGAQWGLSEAQWHEYQQVMKDRRGIWSPGLDPITALGVSTDSRSERRRLAALYVTTAFERTRKELAFQVEVDQAWQRLYPNTPRLAPGRGAQAASVAPVRYALIVAPSCRECQTFIEERLDGLLTEASEGVDVHVMATDGDEDRLRVWVASQPVIRAALNSKQSITVNHGDTFAGLTQLPALYRKNGAGQWSREL